jgi:hypothetical protein
MYTDSQGMQVYYHLPLQPATTTAVQIAAQFPEIMDTPSYEVIVLMYILYFKVL